MAKFNEYTVKATPEDADTLMLYDAASKTNKLSPFSGIWNWMVNKLTNAVINNLQTSNKTVVGALNELNSNSSIRLCRVIFGENTFSSELKGKTYKAIIGFFYKPSDNPFSFNNGYFIAFQSTYLQEENMFVIIGFGFNGTIENKFLALK